MDKTLDLVSSLLKWETWLVVGISALFGLIGGLAHKLTSPPDDKTSKWVYIVVGGIASLSVLYIFSPQEGIKLVALSVAAGYAGKAVLDAMEARVKTALAQADAAQSKDVAKKAIEAGKKAVEVAHNLTQKNHPITKILSEKKTLPKTQIIENLAELDLDFLEESSPGAAPKELEDVSRYLDFLNTSLEK